MNVAHLTGPLGERGGGIPFSVLPLARQLALAGHDVDVFGTDETDSDEAWQPARVRGFAIRGPEQFSYCPGMALALRSGSFDVVHTHGLWLHTSMIATQWQARTSGRRVVSVHGMLNPSALRIGRWKKRVALRLYENRHLHTADCLHALSEAERKAMREFGVTGPVAVVPNGVTMLPEPTGEAIPAWQSSVPENRKVLLYLGRLHPIKGLKELVDGWHAACVQVPGHDWTLVIAGWDDADLLGSLRRKVADLGLGDRVIFVGPQFGDDKMASLRAADAFVLPSTSEGLPVAILEAWSCALPVLMSRHCNLEEGFDGGAAIPADPTCSGVASGLTQLFAMPPAGLQEMGARGRALVEQRFTWEAVAEKMAAVYEWVSGSGRVPDYVDK